MGKKGGSHHLKRLSAPKHWPIHVKENKWTIKPIAGPHPIPASIPLAIAVRDVFHYVKSLREAKIVISEGRIKVDGIPRMDYKFPIGLMDVVDIPDSNSTFRGLPVERRGLCLIQTPEEEKDMKLCRVENKTTVRSGRIQLNLHDGKNLLIDIKDPKKPTEDVYHTLDTILVNIPDLKIIKHFKFTTDSYVLVVNGRNLGRTGKIKKIMEGTISRPILVSIEDDQGKMFQTRGSYIFVIGDEKPAITIGS